jgi:hypothetical protein
VGETGAEEASAVTNVRRDIGLLRTMRWIAVAVAPGCAVAIWLALVAVPGAVVLPVLLLVFDLLLIVRLTLAVRGQRKGAFVRPENGLPPGFTPPSAALGSLAAGASMADFAVGMARLSSALGGCAHADAERVIPSGSTETVGWICPDCDADLPAGWVPPTQAPTPLAACTCGDLPGSWRGCVRHDITAGLR